MLDFSLLGKKTLVELVYEELKGRVLTGQMQAGERVLEVNIANEMIISRTPVREAIRLLEMEGLFVHGPHKGIYVAHATSEELKSIMEIRQDIEGMAAYYAASRITSAQDSPISAFGLDKFIENESMRVFQEAVDYYEKGLYMLLEVPLHLLLPYHHQELTSCNMDISFGQVYQLQLSDHYLQSE